RSLLGPSTQMFVLSACDGSFAVLVLVPDYTLIPAPPAVRDEPLALAEPIAVAAHAVSRIDLEGVQRALVLGGGTIVSLVTRVLRDRGVPTVDVVEPREFLAPTLLSMGATAVHRPEEFSTAGPPHGAVLIAAGRPET